MSLVPHVEGITNSVHHPITRSTRSRRAQTLSIQRQQNSSPPPNATVDTKETLDIPDHSMLPGLSRNQPCRKSEFILYFTDRLTEYAFSGAKKRLQNWSKKLLKRNVGSDAYPLLKQHKPHTLMHVSKLTKRCPHTHVHIHAYKFTMLP